jgi:hypothetical protein
MKVTIHTPRVFAEEWDIPGLPGDTTDAGILAIVAGGPGGPAARRTDATVVDTGSPFVYARGEADFEAMARKWTESRAATARAEDEVREWMLRELELGLTSERAVATALGVDRNTVRGWRGKARG